MILLLLLFLDPFPLSLVDSSMCAPVQPSREFDYSFMGLDGCSLFSFWHLCIDSNLDQLFDIICGVTVELVKFLMRKN
jgi:hypothetical protein